MRGGQERLVPTGRSDEARREYERQTVYYDRHGQELFTMLYWPPQTRWLADEQIAIAD
jgi:hypothetical protein